MLGKLCICEPNELSENDLKRWIAAQRQNPALNSPFLHPEFAVLTARRRLDVRILITDDHLGNRSWFAFHRLDGGLARPIAAPVSDYQGLVFEAGFSASFPEILKEAGIGVMPFSALVDPNGQMNEHQTHSESSYLLDLSKGPEHYFAEQQKQYRKYFKKMRQRARADIRDHGNCEVVTDIKDQQALETLFNWKHQQFTRTKKLDVLNVPWIDALLENAYASKNPDFRAVLSGYKIGGKWAAAELGLLAEGVYHSWIAAYADEYGRNSPGLLLLHGIIEQAPELGIKQIDIGTGHDHYKKYYANAFAELGSGCLLGNGAAAKRRKAIFKVCDTMAGLPLGKLGKLPGKLVGSLDYIAACHPAKKDQLSAFGSGILRKINRAE
ncbi:MAG: GNAT family N-acetyltransferase [Robiginitomaculum sp.]|nr:GNAT family N-acetyltransferase [Robiginitomaculum sp.]